MICTSTTISNTLKALKSHLYGEITSLNNGSYRITKELPYLICLTKDIEAFVNGSWCFPYLLVVPINTLVSAVILYNMFGFVILFSYSAMLGLLALQSVSNKKISQL